MAFMDACAEHKIGGKSHAHGTLLNKFFLPDKLIFYASMRWRRYIMSIINEDISVSPLSIPPNHLIDR